MVSLIALPRAFSGIETKAVPQRSLPATRHQIAPISLQRIPRRTASSSVATRYDKLAANNLAFVKLGCIRLWLAFISARLIAPST